MEGSWQPDPTRRHQYRWWDGSAWTSTVADDGQASSDAGDREPALVGTRRRGAPEAEPVTAPVPEVEEAAPPPKTVPTYDPAGAMLGAVVLPRPPRNYARWIVLGVLVVAAVTVAAVVLVRRHNEYRLGPQIATRTIVSEDVPVQRSIKLRAGEGVRLRVETSQELRVEAFLVVPDSIAGDVAAVATDQAADQGVSLSDVGDVGPSDTGATDAAADSPIVGMTVVATLCCDDEGDTFMTASFVSHATARYLLVVHSLDGVGPVRMIYERFPGPGLQEGQSDKDLLSDGFFSDSGFFTDPDPYTEPAETS